MEGRTEFRVNQVLARTKKRRRQRERHLLGGLTALCLLLTVGLAGTLGAMSCDLQQVTPTVELFATVLLHEGVGGYVLVGVLAFAIGAAITIVCLWWHKKH